MAGTGLSFGIPLTGAADRATNAWLYVLAVLLLFLSFFFVFFFREKTEPLPAWAERGGKKERGTENRNAQNHLPPSAPALLRPRSRAAGAGPRTLPPGPETGESRKAKNEDSCGSISRCKLTLSFPLRRFVAGANCDPGLL